MQADLVTGATGFIGKALVRRLARAGRPVIGLGSADGDLAAPETLARLEDRAIGRVFHLAGRTFVPASWQDPGAFYRANTAATANVLDFCRRRGLPLLVVSAYLYGAPEALPIAESAPVRPNNPYAHSKHLAEQLCRFYADELGCDVTIVRPFNVYGPSQPAHFLIPTIVEQAVGASDRIEMEDLAPRRDYVYVDDLVEAMVVAADRISGYHVYNVGSGRSHSVAELVAAVQTAAGTRKPVVDRRRERKNEIPDVVADITRARTDLSWEPSHSLDEGIRLVLGAETAGA